MSADLEAGASVDLSVSIAAGVGQAVAQALAARDRGPLVPVEVCFPDKADMVLATGQPDHARALGPLAGWVWQVTRIQITGAVAGSYAVYTSIGGALAGAPQEQVPQPGGTAPNTFWEPRGLFLRYGEKLTAVGTGVTTAGIMRAEFINVREDWLATYIV